MKRYDTNCDPIDNVKRIDGPWVKYKDVPKWKFVKDEQPEFLEYAVSLIL